MSNYFLDFDWLKANHEMIHYFGLGFIQLKIDKTFRMHFYTNRLPAIVPEEDVHNHRYDFSSKVLKGKLIQEFFAITDDDTHILEKESCKEGVEAEGGGKPCGLQRLCVQHLHAPSHYFIHHGAFHKVQSDDCITLLERGDYQKELAEVVRLKNGQKVCPFSQKVPEEQLWEIVKDMLTL